MAASEQRGKRRARECGDHKPKPKDNQIYNDVCRKINQHNYHYLIAIFRNNNKQNLNNNMASTEEQKTTTKPSFEEPAEFMDEFDMDEEVVDEDK